MEEISTSFLESNVEQYRWRSQVRSTLPIPRNHLNQTYYRLPSLSKNRLKKFPRTPLFPSTSPVLPQTTRWVRVSNPRFGIPLVSTSVFGFFDKNVLVISFCYCVRYDEVTGPLFYDIYPPSYRRRGKNGSHRDCVTLDFSSTTKPRNVPYNETSHVIF